MSGRKSGKEGMFYYPPPPDTPGLASLDRCIARIVEQARQGDRDPAEALWLLEKAMEAAEEHFHKAVQWAYGNPNGVKRLMVAEAQAGTPAGKYLELALKHDRKVAKETPAGKTPVKVVDFGWGVCFVARQQLHAVSTLMDAIGRMREDHDLRKRPAPLRPGWAVDYHRSDEAIRGIYLGEFRGALSMFGGEWPPWPPRKGQRSDPIGTPDMRVMEAAMWHMEIVHRRMKREAAELAPRYQENMKFHEVQADVFRLPMVIEAVAEVKELIRTGDKRTGPPPTTLSALVAEVAKQDLKRAGGGYILTRRDEPEVLRLFEVMLPPPLRTDAFPNALQDPFHVDLARAALKVWSAGARELWDRARRYVPPPEPRHAPAQHREAAGRIALQHALVKRRRLDDTQADAVTALAVVAAWMKGALMRKYAGECPCQGDVGWCSDRSYRKGTGKPYERCKACDVASAMCELLDGTPGLRMVRGPVLGYVEHAAREATALFDNARAGTMLPDKFIEDFREAVTKARQKRVSKYKSAERNRQWMDKEGRLEEEERSLPIQEKLFYVSPENISCKVDQVCLRDGHRAGPKRPLPCKYCKLSPRAIQEARLANQNRVPSPRYLPPV